MGHGGRTGEHLEMLGVRASNYTPVEDEYDFRVA